jgi:hypothetical protein
MQFVFNLGSIPVEITFVIVANSHRCVKLAAIWSTTLISSSEGPKV